MKLTTTIHDSAYAVVAEYVKVSCRSITGDTLTFRFCINSDCVGVRSLLSKDVEEETVTCELLPVAWLLLTGLVVAITESPRGQASTKWCNFLKEPAYYAHIMLDAFAYLLCSF